MNKDDSILEDVLSEEEENENNEELINENAAGSSNKLMILYVLEVLTKYSDVHHKLTQNDIIKYIKQDYSMDCERKAISRHIKSLVEHGYKIDTYEENGEGYYLKDLEFSSDDVFMLWEGLMASKYITSENAERLIAVLNRYVGEDLRFGNSFYGGITNKYVYPQTFIYSNIKKILTEMAIKKKISFFYNQYAADKTLEVTTEAPLVVSPYAVMNVDNIYYLAAKPEYTEQMQCYRIGMISQIEHMEFICDDIRDISGYSKGFDVERFVSEFIPGYGGSVTDFIVKVDQKNIDGVIGTFGEGFHVTNEETGMLTLEITCNFDKMYQWALANADIAEVTEPAAMRFKLKEYFDLHSWKYR